MRAIAIAAVLTLASCATYSERQAQEPWMRFHTDKSADEFTGCAAPLVRDIWAGMTVAPDGASTVMAYPIPNYTEILATITVTPLSDGADVALRSATETGKFREAAAILRRCQ